MLLSMVCLYLRFFTFSTCFSLCIWNVASLEFVRSYLGSYPLMIPRPVPGRWMDEACTYCWVLVCLIWVLAWTHWAVESDDEPPFSPPRPSDESNSDNNSSFRSRSSSPGEEGGEEEEEGGGEGGEEAGDQEAEVVYRGKMESL